MMNNVHPLFKNIVTAHLPGTGDRGFAELARDDAVNDRIDDRVSELMSAGQVFDPDDADLAIEALDNSPPTIRARLSDALQNGDLAEVGRIVSDTAWDYCLAAAEKMAEREFFR